MKLRHQLLLVSLLLLILQWSAWQYLKSFDGVLRESQAQALIDQAKLIANRVAVEPQLFNAPFSVTDQQADTLYAYLLKYAPIVDGYDDDWRQYNAEFSKQFYDSDVLIQVGFYQQQFYFFIHIPDQSIHYHNPLVEYASSYDQLYLHLPQKNITYTLASSAPGSMVARYTDDAGHSRQESAIKGIWRENAKGYQVELVIDADFLDDGFHLHIYDYDTDSAVIKSLHQRLTHIVSAAPVVQNFLDGMDTGSANISLLNKQQWLIGSTFNTKMNHVRQDSPWILEWLYRKVLESERFPLRDGLHYRSYVDYPEVVRSRANGGDLAWYRFNDRGFRNQTLASVAAPVYLHGHLLGYVLLEKTTDHLIILTTNAFNQLFFYTAVAFFSTMIILLFYASWLSWRISRLNRVAAQAIDAKGTIVWPAGDWPDWQRRDELGDLSRGYKTLLVRVQEYHEYLRTLSNTLSHELRTPIAVVKSSLENLVQVEDDASRKAYSERAYEGVSRLSAILNAMSSANRIEESLADAEFEQVDLCVLLESLVAIYNDVYSDCDIVLVNQVPLAQMLISEELFVQMMDKLIDNAVGFSLPSTPIVISLYQQKGGFAIDVENSGPLLPDAMQDQLFGSMVSVRQSASKDGETHLGLGLYVVRLIVDFHRGKVEANNRNDGSGVVFSLSFPAAQ